MKLKILKKIAQIRKKYGISKEYISFEKEMVAKAVFIGFFIAFIPMPFQMLAVFLVSPFVKFNVPIAFGICWITNPFTMPFIYFLEYSLGSHILGLEINENMVFSIENISNIIMPLYYGAFVISITTATLGYYITKKIWKS